MSQVLTSHSPFKKRSEVAENDTTTNHVKLEESTAQLKNPVDAPASKPSESPAAQDSDASSEDYDELISDEELDDELERAEEFPYICDSEYRSINGSSNVSSHS